MKLFKESAGLHGACCDRSVLMTERKGFSKLYRLFAACLLSISMLLGLSVSTVFAASASDYITALADSSTLPDTTCYLTMRQENMSAVWNSSYDSTDYSVSSGTMDYLYLKVKQDSGTYTYEDPCDIIFTEAGTIAGRAVDITVHIDEVQVYNYSSKAVGTMWSFAAVGPGGWGGGANTLWFWAGSQGGAQKIDYTVHITWHDTGEECGLSFYQCCYDIDVAYTSLTDYKEAWAASLDDYQHFFIYTDSTSTTSITDDNMLKFTSTTQYNVTGTNSITLTGAVGVTKSSTFSGSYWENGGCGTSLEIYSTYANLNEPVKTTDTTKTYSAGDSITWEISYNLGTYYQDVFSPYESIIIKDYLPEAATYVSAALYNSVGTDITASAGTLVYDESQHLVTYTFNENFLNETDNYDGTDYTMVINGVIKNLNISYELANTAYAIIDGIEFTSSTPSVTVVNPTMSIEKTADRETYQVGDIVTYTIKATETTENGTAVNVVVSDTLPDELELVSVSFDTSTGYRIDDGSANGFEIVYDAISYGTVETITVKAKVRDTAVNTEDDSVKNIVTNTVSCQYDNAIDRGEEPITDEVSVTILEPAVSISKAADKTSVQICDDVTWKISVTQSTEGSTVNGDLVVTDIVPEGLHYNEDAVITGENAEYATVSYDDSTGTLTVTFSEFGYGTAYIQYSTNALVSAKDMTLKNAASVATDEPDTNYPEEVEEVPVDIFSPVIITEVVNGSITDSDDCIPYGTDKVIEYAPAEGYLLESVTVDGEKVDIIEYPDSFIFTDVQEDHFIKVVYVKPEMSKAVTKDGEDVDGVVIANGDTLQYTISYENPTGTERTVIISDTVPDGAEVLEDSISDGGVYENGVISWTLKIEAYSKGTVSFSCVMGKETQDRIIENTASVTFYPLDGSTSEKEVTLTDTVETPVLADPEKTALNADGEDIGFDSDGNAVQTVKQSGDTVTYCVSFQNPSVETKTFTVSDKLPEGVAFVSADHDGSYDSETHTVTWTITVEGDQSETVAVEVEILGSAEGSILKNKATVNVDAATLDTNTVEIPVIETPVKDVASELGGESINTMPVQVGEKLYYTVTFENPSDYEKEVVITDVLPDGVSFVSADYDGVYYENTHTVTWTVAVEAHAEITVTVRVKALDSVSGTSLCNQASVKMDEADIKTVTENGEEEDETTTNYVPMKQVMDADGNDIDGAVVAVGDILTYRITYHNSSSNESTVMITDILPQGVLYVSSSDGGRVQSVVQGQTVTWSLDVEAYTGGYVTVTVKVTSELKGQTFANSADVTLQDEVTGQIKTATTNEVSNTVLEDAVKEVLSKNGKKDLCDETVTAGTVLQYRITVKNPSEEEKTFTITDELPEGTEFVSAENGGICEDGTVRWIVTLSGGESNTVIFYVKVLEDAEGGFVQNTAWVTVDNAEISTNSVKTYVEAVEETETDNSNEDTSGEATVPVVTEGPKTGDSANVTLWAVIAGIAGAAALAFGGYALYRRKKEV